ncbi:MAG: S8 family serine peptidase, partial [Bdellovibrionales bacterium]|nr:S8 family serine peptidase [Bdellovibrionales bacterium]
MMKLRDGLALGSLGLVSILFYFNCQKSHEAIQLKNSSFSSLMKKNDGQIPQLISYEANSPYSHQKVVIDFPALIESDEQFRVKNSQLLQDSNGTFSENSSDSIIIPAQTKLVALIDNDCALDKTDKMRDDAIDISQKVLSQNLQFIKEDMRVQTYSFVEDKDQSLSSLVQSADIDECLLGISQNAIYHTTSTVNDPSFDRQRHHNVIHTLDSWDTFYSPGIGIDRDVVVAVIDTGVDYLHPDLTNVMWKSDSGKFGRDFVNNDDDPMDDHFHGTHCAGLVGAQANNQIGVSGSMGYRAKIMAVKVLDSQGSGGIDAISNGVRWATDNGAEIISMSLGGPGKQATMEDALIYALSKGVVVLAAAGNDGRELTSTNFFSPGSYA